MMRKFSSLFARLTTGHLIVLGTAALLAALTMVFALAGLSAAALACLGLLVFGTLTATLLYLSVLAGRLERQEGRLMAQGRSVLAAVADRELDATAPHASGQTLPGPGYDAYASWATVLSRKPRRMERFVNQAKKTRSHGARNVLAFAATRGRMDWRAMTLFLAARRLRPEQTAPSGSDAFWVPGLRAVARVLFCQRTRDDDLANALAVYELLIELQGRQSLEPVDCSYYADLLVTFGRQAEVPEALDYEQEAPQNRVLSQALLRVNALNPRIRNSQTDESLWLGALNDLFASRGLAPIGLVPGPERSFYRVRATAPPRPGSMPLVTVIMPIFEPDEATSAAVGSLLAQTWSNLEILMVDDGSPAVDSDGRPTEFRDRLIAMAARDPRIRLILNEENRGAYWARNVAYSQARGTYVTVADKDDWHHPQKIELQALDLEQHPDLQANMTQWARVDEDLRFVFRWGPDRIIHPSFASIMYRRKEVQERLGFWDSVRKSADNEFRMRLQAAFGRHIKVLGELPMAFSLLGEGNLTSQDFGLGFEQPERRIYRQSYEAWHRGIASGDESPYLPFGPEGRPFVAPESFLPVRPAPSVLDVVFVSGFEYDESEARSLAAAARSAAAEGLVVGIVPAEVFLSRRRSSLYGRRQVEELVETGQASWVTLGRAAHARLLIVRDPALFQVARDTVASLIVGRCIVRAAAGPQDGATGFKNYDVPTVDATIEDVFGLQPEWAAVTEMVKAELQRLLPEARIVAEPMTEHASFPDSGQAAAEVREEPVIGRHLPDSAAFWPGSNEDFQAAFCWGSPWSVRIRGSANYPRKAFLDNRFPETWTILDGDAVSVPTFLDGVDFLVHFPHESAGVNGIVELVEAMAHGVVCILPTTYMPIFGDAAFYCAPAEVQSAIETLWSDAEALQEIRARGRRLAEMSPRFTDLLPPWEEAAMPTA